MDNKKNTKKILISIIVGVSFLIGSFFIYNLTGASSGDNDLKIGNAKIVSIETGEGNFDSSDGLTYDETGTGYTLVDGYTAGNDNNKDNRIVRSFDTIKYNLEFDIKSKTDGNEYDSRTVNVEVVLSDDEAKYVTFDPDSFKGETSHVYSFDGMDTFESVRKTITLYVLGAPNKTEIKPKFNIKESTDEEGPVSLGYISSTQSNYSYEDGTYTNTSNIKNYLPTVVSSTDGRVLVDIEPATADSQKATYEGKNGRFVTYVAGVYLEEDPVKGLKGKTMPTGNITFNANISHTGSNAIVQDSSWNRLYAMSNVGDIEPVVVALPYSTSDSNRSQKEISRPGNMVVTGSNGNLNVTISDYDIKYNFVTLNADDSTIDNRGYIGTYAFTVFSPRVTADGRGDINDTLSISNLAATSTGGSQLVSETASRTLVNSYYKSEDFSLKTDFVTLENEESLSNETSNNTVGSLSKGESFIYKTVFDYNETASSEGLKEVIKVNSNAFRVMPFSDKKNIIIEAKCGENACTNIDESSFEVKFISGSFASDNYELNTIDSRTVEEVKTDITTMCSGINVGALNSDQVLNLYGGPCIKAKENVENDYSNIADAVDTNGKEVPITKVIVQTKNGVVLPDEAEITVKVKLRVRNVQDITRTYQAATVASTSDHDSVLRYYSPLAPEQVTNPNNYLVASINGNSTSKLSTEPYGASLRIANFTVNQEISVLNKNKDGSMKVNYNAVENETIVYNIKTNIGDMNEQVGADDVWYMKSVRVYASLPSDLTYIADSDLDKYLVNSFYYPGGTELVYDIPYTKTNFVVPDIRFKAKVNPKLKGAGKTLTIRSYIDAININDEVDVSMFGVNYSSFDIYATGINNVIVEEQIGAQGTVVEKNTEFSYKLRAFNNTETNVTDYSIVDILPSSGDYLGSKYNGEYTVKVVLPESLAAATIKCSKQAYASIVNEINNSKNEWEECNIREEYVEGVTAIRVDNISIQPDSYTDFIEVFIKPTNNSYSDVYYNSFIGGSESLSTTKSNTIGVTVVSRTIKGRVFIDVNENGVKDNNEINVSGIPVTLYKLDNDASTKVFETTTDKEGNYSFKDLDVGRYYIDLNYNSSIYDLTLRYATENTAIDSDAYIVKESEGLARISNKRIPDDPYGIRLTRSDILIENMDMGLISKKSFSFDMKKYITRIDLAYNGSIDTTNYDNLSKVSISVKNSLNANAKVYYGIAVTNNGTRPGYVKEIQEDIPKGLIFDSNYSENNGWIEVDGKLKNTTLSDIVIEPGETRYLQIVLFMPSRQEAGTFLNTVSIVSMEEYIPVELATDTTDVASTKYTLGESVSYAGFNWHVIGTEDISADEQKVTLMADANQLEPKSHGSGTYSWANSYINDYLTNTPLRGIDKSALYDVTICNDASGLPVGSYGGSISGLCQSQMFVTSKIRLITNDEITRLRQSLSSLGWLFASNFWTQSSDYVTPLYNEFGVQQNSVASKALSIDNGNPTETEITESRDVRPVITISSKKILFE